MNKKDQTKAVVVVGLLLAAVAYYISKRNTEGFFGGDMACMHCNEGIDPQDSCPICYAYRRESVQERRRAARARSGESARRRRVSLSAPCQPANHIRRNPAKLYGNWTIEDCTSKNNHSSCASTVLRLRSPPHQSRCKWRGR